MTWEIVFGLGALALALGIAWGLVQYKRRNKANDALTEAATHEEYHHPERFKRTQQDFRDQVKR